ncbi:MAG: AhpC/TSA family protein [Nitriliruptorales bacterium]
MPCKSFLSQLARAQDEIEELGGGVVAIGRTSREQAGRLEDRWVPYPCLVDPRASAYRALGIRRLTRDDLTDPGKLWLMTKEYAKGVARGTMQGRLSSTPQLPGVAVLDEDMTLHYLYRGGMIGDYPPLEEVLGALREVASGRRR